MSTGTAGGGWHRRGDLRRALRRLGRSSGYACAVMVNLALGIAATTAIIAVIRGVVLRPLPYPDPNRLVVIEHEMPGIEIGGQPTRFGAFQGQAVLYAERSRLLEAVGVFGTYDAAVSGEGEAAYVRAGYASAGFFRALGTSAELGRLPRDDEAAGEAQGAVLLSHAAWTRRYGEDPGAVGATLRVDGAGSRVVGVLGPQGPFPEDRVSLWIPRTTQQIRQTPQLLVEGLVARLRPGASAESLERELDGLIAELPDHAPDDFVRRAVEEGRLRSKVTPLTDRIVGEVAGSLWLLLAAAGLVLVAALANVTNLRLLRNEAQLREMAVRRALGARRLDLLREHLAEAGVLTLASGVAGGSLAALAVGWVVRSGLEDLPRAEEVTFGALALGVIVALGLLATLWLSAVQAAARPRDSEALRSTRSGGGSRSRARLRGLTAAAELAVAVVLLVGAGLLLRSFLALSRVELGFVPESVVTFRVPFPFQEVADAGGSGRATPFYDALADRLSQLPGVASVGYARCTPLSRLCGLEGLTFLPANRPPAAGEPVQLLGVLQVGPGYHTTLGIPLLAGRHLERRDHAERTQSIVVSAAAARQLWGDADPVGRELITPDIAGWPPMRVVGVVGDVRHTDLRGAPETLVYLPVLMQAQPWELWTVTFVARTTVPPFGVVDEIRSVVRQMRPDVPVAHVETLAVAVARSTARERLAILLIGAAALATLILGATGVYGVVAYATSLRRGEFGIRSALGADGRALGRLVLSQGATIAAAGLSLGLGAALWGSRLLESVLFEVTPSDPATYLAVAVLLGATALAASYGPARQAAETDPAEVLRGE